MHIDRRDDQRTKALRALGAALKDASECGLRDLHEALQTGVFRGPMGRARLIRGNWGDVGHPGDSDQLRTTCPLNALFVNDADHYAEARLAPALAAKRMSKYGFLPEDFYVAWDRGLLGTAELRERVEAELTSRLCR